MLEVASLTRRYGGLVANDAISFRVEAGEILGVIGPNGAGKSTLFELISGFERPDAGDVRFQGRSIVGLRPDRINRLGIVRTFQKLKPFAQMTVEENVMVGVLQHTARVRAARDEALAALEFVGLLDRRRVPAHGLSTGQRKRLELARAMSTRPRLMLLDEVTGGVDQRSIGGLIELVARLRGEGMTVVLIEHNMQVLMSLADRVLALQLGRKIAEGTPQAVRSNREVIESYLGTAYA
jgi:branched-chain amino acid transport system ATP-binding protein